MEFFSERSTRLPRAKPAFSSERCCPRADGEAASPVAGRDFPARSWYVFYILPLGLYASLILFLSSLSQVPNIVPSYIDFDKLLHFLEYAPFGYLIMRTWVTSSRGVLLRVAVFGTIFCGTVFGALDEFHQSFVPGRDASVFDVLADFAGVATAAFTYRIVRFNLSWIRAVEDGIEKGFFHGA